MTPENTIPAATPALNPTPENPAVAPLGILSSEDDDQNQRTRDTDSAYGDDTSQRSEMTSLASGITRYREENGRRYHAYKDGNYLLPNDDAEQDRLDLHHHVFCLALGHRLFLAPIQNPKRVLDAGTGTGIWAIDFADQFPSAHVIGSDLSPIQPGWIPPNLEFEVDDIEETWPRSRPYSYIHFRSLSGAIKDWQRLLQQAWDNLEPGGYLEVTEFEVWMHSDDGTLQNATMIRKWQENLKIAGDLIGRRFDVAVNLKTWMQEAGFLDVKEIVTKVPSTPWPRDRTLREIGLYQQQNMLDASSSYGQAHFTRVLGWSPAEYHVLSANVRNEFKDRSLHLYSNLFVVFGQKPSVEQDKDEEQEQQQQQQQHAVEPQTPWTHDPDTYNPEAYHPQMYDADTWFDPQQ